MAKDYNVSNFEGTDSVCQNCVPGPRVSGKKERRRVNARVYILLVKLVGDVACREERTRLSGEYALFVDSDGSNRFNIWTCGNRMAGLPAIRAVY